MKHYTSIEQSKKLLELGMNPESADFEYKCVGFTMHTTRPTDDFKYKVMLKEQNIPHEPKYDIPCWSLGALLELANLGCCADEIVHIEIESWLLNPNVHIYIENLDGESITRGNHFGNNTLEAAFNMVVWLLENGYIKNDPKTFSE